MPVIAINKQGLREYEVLETIQAGIVLSGPEVKSTKAGNVSLRGSYVDIKGNGVYLINCHIASYKTAKGQQVGYVPTHTRKLLLRNKQILELQDKKKAYGATIIPQSVETKGSLVKVMIALARGLGKRDKRLKIKKKEVEREMRRALKQ
ncbi:MAG: SsrA-binding protein SmpB [bacterium]